MSPLPAVLQTLVKNAEWLLNEYPDVEWIDDIVTPADIRAMEKEASGDDTFDKLKMKKTMWAGLRSGESTLAAKSCRYAKVIYCQLVNGDFPIPWALWGRIFQWFALERPIRVFFFMSPIQRMLPDIGKAIGPECVNGGYTYPCRTDGIVVYRYEECTRVLIHELLHAGCTDNFSFSTELREAKTESWAELIYIALLSKGHTRIANRLWRIQKQWMSDLNQTLIKYYNIRSYSDYVYRYTVARDTEFRRYGVDTSDVRPLQKPVKRCRFTAVELERLALLYT